MLAILITLAAAVFQRMTGPTNPKQVRFTLNNKEYRSKMPRSITNNSDFCNFKFTIKDLPDEVVAHFFMRKYRSDEEWTQLPVARKGDRFSVQLSAAPAAAKIEYYVSLETNAGIIKSEKIVMRYKDNVPAYLLIPHILLMFTAMLLSNLAGLLAFFRRERYMGYAKIAFACLLLGGLVLGCLVQKAAFGQYWTGFPLGSDMTDNKTLLVFLIWLIALVANWKVAKRPVLVVIAAIFMLLVYCVPHSLGGSEYDYKTREVMTFISFSQTNTP